MPALDERTELELIGHLDQPTPCMVGVAIGFDGVKASPCPNSASHDMTCRRCAAALPICGHHVTVITALKDGKCHRCHHEGRPTQIFTFYPIGADR